MMTDSTDSNLIYHAETLGMLAGITIGTYALSKGLEYVEKEAIARANGKVRVTSRNVDIEGVDTDGEPFGGRPKGWSAGE